MVSYAVRFPELAARSKTIGGEIEMDPAVHNLSTYQQPNRLEADLRIH